MLEVVDPGALLVIEDRGRPGLAHLGVAPSGALDMWGLSVANVLAGAPADGAAAEVTLGGAELRVVETCAVAIAGADLGAERDDGRPLGAGTVHLLPAGSRLRFVGGRSGMRAYLGFAGGIVADRVLGSASTWLPGAETGVAGRALTPGDRLTPVRHGSLDAVGRTWPTAIAPHPSTATGPVRFVPGPDLGDLPDDAAAALAAATWRASPASDRMGIRLDGSPMAAGHEILSHPIVPGSIQVPAEGRPIIVLQDGPTIGGYPVVGVVPRAELPRLGQVRPGDALNFEPQDAESARDARRDQQARFARAVEALGADAVWQRLHEGAGG